MKTIATSLIALALFAGVAEARPIDSLFSDIGSAAPRSLFTDLNDAAPRSPFDQLADTAPRSLFDDVQDAAPLAAPGDVIGTGFVGE